MTCRMHYQSRTVPPGKHRMGPLVLGPFLDWSAARSGRNAGGLFDNGKAHPGLVAVLFRDGAPGILGFLAGLERTLHLGRAFHELVEVHRTELAANHPEIAAFGHDSLLLLTGRWSAALAELVHRVMGAARLQRGFTGEIFLVIVTDIGAGHVLMLRTGDALTDLLALHILHVAQHALLA